MPNIALITGITGQDGSFLAELLSKKGYEVHGFRRRVSQPHIERLVDYGLRDLGATPGIVLHYGDMTDTNSLIRTIYDIQPNEIYNLAAQSHVRVSFDTAEYTHNVNAIGTIRLLDAINSLNMTSNIRFYQASSSEMFGNSSDSKQNETTPFAPRSPYAASKVSAHWSVVNYREGTGLYASCGILFNHESPRRSPTFVTRKITLGVALFSIGRGRTIQLGNLDALRDWGYAPEYVNAMWLMLQQDSPGDYVIGTGHTQSVRSFVEQAFHVIGRTIVWRGSGIDEKGFDTDSGQLLVSVDPWYFRPTEVNMLRADPRKAARELGWQAKTSENELVKIMVSADIRDLKRDSTGNHT